MTTTKQIESWKDRAIRYYKLYRKFQNKVYDADELEGDKLNSYIDEQL